MSESWYHPCPGDTTDLPADESLRDEPRHLAFDADSTDSVGLCSTELYTASMATETGIVLAVKLDGIWEPIEPSAADTWSRRGLTVRRVYCETDR